MKWGSPLFGEVAEWSKANDSKSFEGQPSVGSNPTLSVFSLFEMGRRSQLSVALQLITVNTKDVVISEWTSNR